MPQPNIEVHYLDDSEVQISPIAKEMTTLVLDMINSPEIEFPGFLPEFTGVTGSSNKSLSTKVHELARVLPISEEWAVIAQKAGSKDSKETKEVANSPERPRIIVTHRVMNKMHTVRQMREDLREQSLSEENARKIVIALSQEIAAWVDVPDGVRTPLDEATGEEPVENVEEYERRAGTNGVNARGKVSLSEMKDIFRTVKSRFAVVE